MHATWKRSTKIGADVKETSGAPKSRMDFGAQQAEPGASLYNGEKCILYWADVTSEIAFVVPTDKTSSDALVWNTIGTSK